MSVRESTRKRVLGIVGSPRRGGSTDIRATFAGRRVVLTIPLGGGSSYARHTVGMLTDIVDYLGMEPVATVLAPGAHRPGTVRGHTDVLAKARRAGREAIEMQN